MPLPAIIINDDESARREFMPEGINAGLFCGGIVQVNGQVGDFFLYPPPAVIREAHP